MFPTKWNNSLSLSNILVDFVFSSKPGGYVGFGSLPDQVLIQKLTFGLLINIHKQVYETCCLCDGLNFKNVLMRHYILALANTFFNIINIWQFKESLPTNLSINALRHWASFFLMPNFSSGFLAGLSAGSQEGIRVQSYGRRRERSGQGKIDK